MARLGSGQIAKGIAAKSQRLTKSARNLSELVRKAAMHPNKVDEVLRARIKTFRTMAQWDDPSLSIFRMSENTLRKNIATVCPGGLAEFERLRAKALGREPEKHAPAKNDYKTLLNHLIEFNAQYLDLLERVTDLAGANPRLTGLIRSHLKLFPHARNGLVVARTRERTS